MIELPRTPANPDEAREWHFDCKMISSLGRFTRRGASVGVEAQAQVHIRCCQAG